MIKLLYQDDNVKRLYMEKNDDVVELYNLFIEEHSPIDFMLKDLDCYKEYKCGYSCRKVFDDDMRECNYVRRICKEFYNIEYDDLVFVDYEKAKNYGNIFSFYGIVEL